MTIEITVYGNPAPQGSWMIYTLASTTDGRVRYVGVTKQRIRKRIRAHLRRSISNDTHKDRWLRVLQTAGESLACRIVESGEGGGWAAAERKWIAKCRAEGFDLTNTTDGGEGCEGYRHSPEIKAAQSARQRGRRMPPEQRAAISASLKGRSLSAATRARMTGRRITEETRTRMSAAQTGHYVAPETLAKMSAARKGKPLSDRARAARPKSLSASHRHAISLGLIRRNAK